MAEIQIVLRCIFLAVAIDYCAVVFANSGSTAAVTFTVSSVQPSGTLSTQAPSTSPSQNNTVANLAFSPAGDLECPDGLKCSDLGASCIRCEFNDSCVYGENVEVQCTAFDSIKCTGSRTFTRIFNCRYCYQTSLEGYKCTERTGCRVVSSPQDRYRANCTVNDNVLCLGNRTFAKLLLCNWTSGYRWSTAVLLSLTLGGFGVDRFYLGHWKEGLGKLFSFGGLGVWTLVDLILIAIGYVAPADGSLYIF